MLFQLWFVILAFAISTMLMVVLDKMSQQIATYYNSSSGISINNNNVNLTVILDYKLGITKAIRINRL